MHGVGALSSLRGAFTSPADLIFALTPLGAIDVIEAHVRSWLAAHPTTPQPLCDAVRGCYGT